MPSTDWSTQMSKAKQRYRVLATAGIVALPILVGCGAGPNELADVSARERVPEDVSRLDGPGALPRIDWEGLASADVLFQRSSLVVVIEESESPESVLQRTTDDDLTMEWIGRKHVVSAVLSGTAEVGDVLQVARLGYSNVVIVRDEAREVSYEHHGRIEPNVALSSEALEAGYQPPLEGGPFLVGLVRVDAADGDSSPAIWAPADGPNAVLRLTAGRGDGNLVVAAPDDVFRGSLQSVLAGQQVDNLRRPASN